MMSKAQKWSGKVRKVKNYNRCSPDLQIQVRKEKNEVRNKDNKKKDNKKKTIRNMEQLKVRK